MARFAVFLLFGSIVFWPPAPNRTAAAEPDNEVLDRLLGKGGLPGTTDAALTKPIMADGLDRARQRETVAGIVDANHSLETFERKTVVAPFVLKISGDEGAEKNRTLRRIDLCFIAYGKLETIAAESFWKSVREAARGEKENRELSSTRTAILSADELKSRGIVDPDDQRHITADLTLLNRVRICATMRAMQTRSADSLTLAAMLDPRFDDDGQFPNCWWPISRDDNGRQHVGTSQAYRTAGWYCKATQLHEPAGALFIEYHVLFDEPAGWFNGAHYLSSKLPIIIQEGVRKFRRQLAQASTR